MSDFRFQLDGVTLTQSDEKDHRLYLPAYFNDTVSYH